MEGGTGLKEGWYDLGPLLLSSSHVKLDPRLTFLSKRVIYKCIGLFNSHNRVIDSFMVKYLNEC